MPFHPVQQDNHLMSTNHVPVSEQTRNPDTGLCESAPVAEPGYFIFPTWMAPNSPDIWMDACVVIKKISTCGGYTQPAKNPELVLISTWMPYHNMIDAYMDLNQPIP